MYPVGRPLAVDSMRSSAAAERTSIGNEIFQERTRGVGIIPRDIALQYGLSGPNLRGSGVDWDLRRDQVLPLAKVYFRMLPPL